MIAFLRGRVQRLTPEVVVLDVNGVGYLVAITAAARDRMPSVGGETELQIYTQVREDQLALYGFASIEELEMFRMLIETGHRMVEGGPGHYDYKLRLGAEEHSLRRIVVSGRSGPSRLRTALLLRWADLLQLVYYRGWFLKVRPRLGLSPRPLRRPWIKTRI